MNSMNTKFSAENNFEWESFHGVNSEQNLNKGYTLDNRQESDSNSQTENVFEFKNLMKMLKKEINGFTVHAVVIPGVGTKDLTMEG